METDPVSETLSSLEYRALDKVQKPNNRECCTRCWLLFAECFVKYVQIDLRWTSWGVQWHGFSSLISTVAPTKILPPPHINWITLLYSSLSLSIHPLSFLYSKDFGVGVLFVGSTYGPRGTCSSSNSIPMDAQNNTFALSESCTLQTLGAFRNRGAQSNVSTRGKRKWQENCDNYVMRGFRVCAFYWLLH
jgi:hypothetical protein